MESPKITVEKEDGSGTRVYALGKMAARKSWETRLRLVKLLGESLFRLLTSGGFATLDEAQKAGAAVASKGTALTDAQKAGVNEAMAAISNLSVEDMMSIADTVFASCRCDGSLITATTFDACFAEVPAGTVEKVLFAALKLNYAGFLAGVR